MGYKVTGRLKIDLSDIGTDNNGNAFFAELQHPKLLTFDQKVELRKFQQIEKKKKTNPDGTVEEIDLTPDEQEENARRILAFKDYIQSFLRAWNLLDIDDETKIVPVEGKPFQRVPSEVTEKIFQEFSNAMQQSSDETKN
jgi:hypothetical protein